MRMVYTSPRIANVERVVALMAEAGIETRIANKSALRHAKYKRISYTGRQDRSTWAQVLVVRSEDRPHARQLLREAGLEPANRFADELAAAAVPGDPSRARRASWRIKIVAVALIVGIAMLMYFG